MIFFYREGSFKPFHVDIPKTLLTFDHGGHPKLNENDPGYKQLAKLLKDREDHYGNVLELPFVSLFSYLNGLLELTQVLSEYKTSFSPPSEYPKILLYLAAAVSDFYIPRAQMSEHKLQSRDPNDIGLKLELQNSPKILKTVREIGSNLILVSFKLETDEDILEEKVFKSMKEYRSDYIVANILSNRFNQVYLYTKGKERVLIHLAENRPLEEDIVHALVDGPGASIQGPLLQQKNIN